MMELKVERFKSNQHETIGRFYVNGKHVCYSLEDERREVKVKSETRIPAGRYEIKLRTIGEHHVKYAKRYTFHRGMLWLQNVPGFEYILIHIGNTDKDTAGCLLIGESYTMHQNRFTISQSAAAYERIYPLVAKELTEGRKVFITIVDEA